MTVDDFMKERGFTGPVQDSIRPEVTYWYKKVPETEHHQVIVKMWPPLQTPTHQHSMPSFEVEMTYETHNEIWANTKFYGLSYTELCANLTRLEACLKQSLFYMDANPLHYRYDGKD